MRKKPHLQGRGRRTAAAPSNSVLTQAEVNDGDKQRTSRLQSIAHSIDYLRASAAFKFLEIFAVLAVPAGVIWWKLEEGDRLKERHYRAWELINTARGSSGDGGRIDALQDLNEDKVSLAAAPLERAYLREVDLADANLAGAALEYADLEAAKLKNANLWRANLARASLSRADLDSADLSGATLEGASVLNGHLRNANLSGANMKNVWLSDAVLDDADMVNANLEDAIVISTTLRGSRLMGARLVNANFAGSNFERADLTEADLGRGNLRGVNLKNARLTKANLDNAILDGANLEGAYFENMVIAEYDCTGEGGCTRVLPSRDIKVVFSKRGMMAESVTVNGADLRGALNLTQAQVNAAMGDARTLLPEGLERPAHWQGEVQLSE